MTLGAVWVAYCSAPAPAGTAFPRDFRGAARETRSGNDVGTTQVAAGFAGRCQQRVGRRV